MKATQTTTKEITPGDIMVSHWGYNMILNTFYIVLKRTPKTVTMVEIGSTPTENWSNMRGDVMPNPAHIARWPEYHKSHGGPKTLTRKLHDDGYVNINEYASAYKWDGKPCYEDHWD